MLVLIDLLVEIRVSRLLCKVNLQKNPENAVSN